MVITTKFHEIILQVVYSNASRCILWIYKLTALCYAVVIFLYTGTTVYHLILFLSQMIKYVYLRFTAVVGYQTSLTMPVMQVTNNSYVLNDCSFFPVLLFYCTLYLQVLSVLFSTQTLQLYSVQHCQVVLATHYSIDSVLKFSLLVAIVYICYST